MFLNPKNALPVAQHMVSLLKFIIVSLWTLEQYKTMNSTPDPTLTFKVSYFKVT